MVGGYTITQPRISLPRIDGNQDYVLLENDQPVTRLMSKSSVQGIAEESETSTSEIDSSDDDEIQDSSLVRNTQPHPRQSQHKETRQEFIDPVNAKNSQEGPSTWTDSVPMPNRKPQLPEIVIHSSCSDEHEIQNKTLLSPMDMAGTISQDVVPVMAKISENAVNEAEPETHASDTRTVGLPANTYVVNEVLGISNSAGPKRNSSTPATVCSPSVGLPSETKSDNECRAETVELERLPAMSLSAGTLKVPKRPTASRGHRNISDVDGIENAKRRRGRPPKSNKQVTCSIDLNVTPSHGHSKKPIARALLQELEVPNMDNPRVYAERSRSKGRALRKLAPTNYKEPSLLVKLRNNT